MGFSREEAIREVLAKGYEPSRSNERIGPTPDGSNAQAIKPVYIRRLVRLIEAAQ